MSDGTKIEWTDATWNPIVGCSVVSPGCTNCYAMRLAGTRMKSHPSRVGLTRDSKAGPVWTGEVRFMEPWLTQPLRWSKPRMIFVCAHADLFHEAVPDEWIDRVFAIMALCHQHTFQVLTKRPERMRDYMRTRAGDWNIALPDAFEPGAFYFSRHEMVARLGDTTPEHRALYNATLPCWPLPNVWLGVSVEDQRRADERIPLLLDTPAAVRWCSAEPLLGPLDLTRIVLIPSDHPERGKPDVSINALTGWLGSSAADMARLDWVVAGPESGPNARPAHIDWGRSLRDQCAAANVPFLWKQNGAFEDHGPAWGPAAGSADDLAGCVFVAPDGSTYRRREDAPYGSRAMYRVGKKAAGRLLDGVIHDAYPEVHLHG